jgi:hypothetical protein
MMKFEKIINDNDGMDREIATNITVNFDLGDGHGERHVMLSPTWEFRWQNLTELALSMGDNGRDTLAEASEAMQEMLTYTAALAVATEIRDQDQGT